MYKILGSDQKEYGPITGDQVRQWIAERRLHAQSLVRLDGSLTWIPLAQLPEFSAALAASGPAALSVAAIAPRTNPMAITGMIMGIIALLTVFCCLPVLFGLPGLLFSVLGIIFSSIALAQIKKNPEYEHGKGLAITGLVLFILSLALFIVMIAFVGLALGSKDFLNSLKK